MDQPTPATPARTRRGSRRTGFGTVRRLPSGRYQARFTDDRMERRTAPATFATRGEAADYLATVRADMVRGLWRAPELGTITVAAYAESLLAVRVDLAPKTRQLYGELLRLWIDAPHVLSTARRGSNCTIHLGSMELGSLTVAVIRDWYAAAIHTTDQRAATRRDAAERKAALSGHPARAWARAQGMAVAPTGRLSTAVVEAWDAAGRPTPHRVRQRDPAPAGRANLPGSGRPASRRPTATSRRCSSRPSATAGSRRTPARSPPPA